MITFSNMCSSYTSTQFKSRNKQKQNKPQINKQQVNKNNNSNSNNTTSKVKTGALVTTALIAGLGIGNNLPSASKADANTNKIENNNITNNQNQNQERIISFEEAQKQMDEQENLVCILNDTVDNGKNVIENKYTIKKVAMLKSQTIKNIETGEIYEKADYSDYIHIPKKEIYTDKNNKLLRKKIINEFDYDTNSSKSIDKIKYNEDGSKDSTNISNPVYKVEYTYVKNPKNTPKIKPTQKSNPNTVKNKETQNIDMDKELEIEILNMLLE